MFRSLLGSQITMTHLENFTWLFLVKKKCGTNWFFCGTIWLLSGTIWLGTIWSWNELTGYLIYVIYLSIVSRSRGDCCTKYDHLNTYRPFCFVLFVYLFAFCFLLWYGRWFSCSVRFMVISPTSRFANILFTNFWSRFAYELGQFRNCSCLISGWKNEIYTCVLHLFVSQ